MGTPSVSVVVCTTGLRDTLRDSVASLLGLRYPRARWELIVVQNGSLAAPPALPAAVRLEHEPRPGLSHARNTGIRLARGGVVAFVDDDALVEPDWLENLIEAFEESSVWAAGGPVQALFEAPLPDWFAADFLKYLSLWDMGSSRRDLVYPELPRGTNVAFRRQAFDRVGTFAAALGRTGPALDCCEETELALRIVEAGRRVVYAPTAVVRHRIPASRLTPEWMLRRFAAQGRSEARVDWMHGGHRSLGRGFASHWRRAIRLRDPGNWAEVLRRCCWRACVAYAAELPRLGFRSPPAGVATPRRPAAPRSPGEPAFRWERVEGFEAYLAAEAASATEKARRRGIEAAAVRQGDRFTVAGRCWVCDRVVDFLVDYSYAISYDGEASPNWREHLLCPGCNLNSRMRASVHFLGSQMETRCDARIYVTEQTTPLFRCLEGRYPELVGSEYLGRRVPFGQRSAEGIRNETLERLTFADASFDVVVCLEVLEHLPRVEPALAECRRVLRPGGHMLFTVPFRADTFETVLRARRTAAGGIQHLLPAEYHGDPLTSAGCLTFHAFGWELLERVRRAGFADVAAYGYWSRELAYLGPQMLFLAAVAPET